MTYNCLYRNDTGSLVEYGATVLIPAAGQTYVENVGKRPAGVPLRHTIYDAPTQMLRAMDFDEITVVDILQDADDRIRSQGALHLPRLYATTSALPQPSLDGMMVRVLEGGVMSIAISSGATWIVFRGDSTVTPV